MVSVDLPDTTTGRLVCYVPEGPDRDLFLGLMRLGESFSKQQVGKRPGKLAQLVLDCARRAGPPYSFKQLLYELDIEAACRNQDGERASPIERVSRSREEITYWPKKDDERRIQFVTLRGKLTAAKKILRDEILSTAKPRKRPAKIRTT